MKIGTIVKRIALVALLVGVVATLTVCQTTRLARQGYIERGSQYEVRILRDTWGVPHIFGKTDADAAYGLAFAHAEDDFKTIQESLLAARGKLAAVQGKDAAPIDYMVHLLRIWEDVETKYATDLSPETRAICEAYADGINHYAALHPEESLRGTLPTTGQDIVAGFVFKSPFFFGLDGAVKELFGDSRKREVSKKQDVVAAVEATGEFLYQGMDRGSNTFAVAPSRSADGFTRLAVNSHQPWDGPVAWYEAHLHSEEGWDMVGGVFPGTPLILHGHNRQLGWAHTVNSPDLVDIYVLDINPDNPNQYRFDGQWRDLEVRKAPLTVKIWGPIRWTVKREVLYSVYGPVVRQDHGTYAIRYAGMGDIRQVEQWFRMNKAQDFEAWQDAMRMQSIASFNCGYADAKGNIYYLYNALLPLRAAGYNWEQYLPGDTSETLWNEYLPFDDLPQVLNPASGFIQNSNSSPFQTTTGPGNPLEQDYDPSFGIETHMTNRALRAVELFDADTSITREAFFTYKYDMKYSKNSLMAIAIREVLALPTDGNPLMEEVFGHLRAWDLNTNPENTHAAAIVPAMQSAFHGFTRGPTPEAFYAELKKKAERIKATHGKLDVSWANVNRLRRGDTDIGMGGGPDILHAAYGEFGEDGRVTLKAGDCYVMLVEWTPDGTVSSRSIHQYGSATIRADSPHYADQAPLFAARNLKPTWMDETEIRSNLDREYRPGQD